jgi:hypothetical protein
MRLQKARDRILPAITLVSHASHYPEEKSFLGHVMVLMQLATAINCQARNFMEVSRTDKLIGWCVGVTSCQTDQYMERFREVLATVQKDLAEYSS